MTVGDAIINSNHYSRLKDLKSDWEKIVKPSTEYGDIDRQRELSLDAQSQAFQKLADAEKSLATASEQKQYLYWTAAAAYAAAALVAWAETWDPKGWAPCKPIAKVVNINGSSSEISKKITTIEKRTNSLYNYYSLPERKLEFQSKQLQWNLENSHDFVSLIMNKKALDETNSSPSIDEYEHLHKLLKDQKEINNGAFKFLKDIYVKVSHELNPIQSVHAESNAEMTYNK